MSSRPLPPPRTLLIILLGNALYALDVVLFLLPSGMITGGTTGLALFFFHQFGLPVSVFVWGFNLLTFLLGAWVLGRSFALTTLVSSIAYPTFLGLFQRLPLSPPIADDLLLSAIFCGLLIGVSIGLILQAGASSGGMDIPPLILQHKLGIPVAVSLYGFDLVILLLQAFFTDVRQVFYGILMVLVYTLTLDKVLLTGLSRTQVKIVSASYREICDAIIRQIDRGCTLIRSESGFCHDEGFMVLTVISNRELPRLNRLVLSIDPGAFMVISRVSEVKGRGFSLSRDYRRPE